MANRLRLTNRDFYGNSIETQIETVSMKHEASKHEEESPDHRGYNLKESHLTSEQIGKIVESQIHIYLKGEPATNLYTLELTIKEEKSEVKTE